MQGLLVCSAIFERTLFDSFSSKCEVAFGKGKVCSGTKSGEQQQKDYPHPQPSAARRIGGLNLVEVAFGVAFNGCNIRIGSGDSGDRLRTAVGRWSGGRGQGSGRLVNVAFRFLRRFFLPYRFHIHRFRQGEKGVSAIGARLFIVVERATAMAAGQESHYFLR